MDNKLNIHANKRFRFIFTGTLFFLMIFIFMGCLASFGNIRPSKEVETFFETNQILPDHKYYYTGSDNAPDAILGIHRNYTLDNDTWIEINLTPEQLKYWVRRITNNRGYSLTNYGYRIVDPSGNPIGIYYSSLDWVPVKMGENNRVIVYTPSSSMSPKRSHFYNVLGE